MRERTPWLDYVRMFSIFLVILYHTPPRSELLDEAVILNLRVPVFFCISGFLFNDGRWSGFWRYAWHRGKQILIPYVLFFAVFYGLWLWFGRDLLGGEDARVPVTQPLVEMVMGNPKTIVGPFWYIACLMTMQLIYWWIAHYVPRRWTLAVCLVIAASTYWLKWTWPWVEFWNLGNALLFMPFYALGHSLRPQFERIKFRGPASTMGLLAVAASSMLAMTWVVGVRAHDPGLYSLLRVACGLLVIPAYLCVGKWVARLCGRHRFIELIVLGGTIYLGLQNYAIGIIRIGIERVAGTGWLDSHAWLRLVIALVVMAAIYPISAWIQRHAPWIIGRSRASRT